VIQVQVIPSGAHFDDLAPFEMATIDILDDPAAACENE
jgi:hypothetical protein